MPLSASQRDHGKPSGNMASSPRARTNRLSIDVANGLANVASYPFSWRKGQGRSPDHGPSPLALPMQRCEEGRHESANRIWATRRPCSAQSLSAATWRRGWRRTICLRDAELVPRTGPGDTRRKWQTRSQARLRYGKVHDIPPPMHDLLPLEGRTATSTGNRRRCNPGAA